MKSFTVESLRQNDVNVGIKIQYTEDPIQKIFVAHLSKIRTVKSNTQNAIYGQIIIGETDNDFSKLVSIINIIPEI